MAYKVGQNVIDFGGDKDRYGWIVSIARGQMHVQFNDNGETVSVSIDDEWFMSVEDWNRAGRELRAEERAERRAFGLE